MGALDQIAKATFALETEDITGGAIAWEGPQEVGLHEVRLDGLLAVRDPGRASGLAPPWREASRHEDVVVEVKMPGDHLNALAIRRAELRRAAWHVRRNEQKGANWRGSVGLWLVAPRVPEVLRSISELHEIGPGCHAMGHPGAVSIWIAANDLPLEVELVPFLLARSGKKREELREWADRLDLKNLVRSMIEMERMDEARRQAILKEYGLDKPPPGEEAWWAFVRQADITRLHQAMLRVPDLGEVREEAQVLHARRALQRVLRRRGLMLSQKQEERIERCEELDVLDEWLDNASTATTIEQVFG